MGKKQVAGVFVFFAVLQWGCASLFNHGSYSSHEGGRRHAATPHEGKMDGVEYYINQDLVFLSRGHSRKPDFPELLSDFETSQRPWRPRQDDTIPIVRNERVDKWIHVFANGSLRKNFSKWMTRAGRYAPIMEDILAEYGLPPDLIYLAMIESGFNVHAYSRAHAAGAWQFIPSTGRLYGLESGIVDERRDLLKATHAAAAHLKDLYQLYGDWYLAFAAYNAGPGKVNRAIKHMGTRNYWKLSSRSSRYLRQETKDYVPRILAAAIVTKNYRKYGFSARLFERPLKFDIVTVPNATDVEVISRCAGVSVKEIEFLNPSLVRGVTPPGRGYTVLIPPGGAKYFKNHYAKIPGKDRTQYAFHRVKKRETLHAIAKHYHISTRKLAHANAISTRSRITRGQTLLVPVQKKRNLPDFPLLADDDTKASPAGAEIYALEDIIGENTTMNTEPASEVVAVQEQPKQQTKPKPGTHVVRQGDTLYDIARQYGLTVADLKAINGFGKTALIKPGQRLHVQSSGKSHPGDGKAEEDRLIIHLVRRGETLWELARRYRVTVGQLREWNNLSGNQLVPRQKIRIYAHAGGLSEREALAYNR